MKEPMDHSRCSELLLDYVQGELSESLGAEVRAHLESCDECSAERRSIEIMLAVPVPEMSESERRELHRGIAGRVGSASATLPARAPSPARRRWGRVLPALGAAAVLALGVVFAANLLTGSSGNDSGAAGGGVQRKGADEADQLEFGAKPAHAPGTGPIYDPGPHNLTEKFLTQISKKDTEADLPAAEAGALTSKATSYTDLLEAQAPANTKSQIRSCVDTVTANEKTAVPVYATTGTYQNQSAFLIRFIAGSDGGPLNRYMLWLWPQGSCAAPLDYRSGRIKK